MYYKQEIGKIGEEQAVKFLIRSNYKIIQRNFRCNFGEIDIIAIDNKKKEIVFVEVKTRRNQRYGNPSESVNFHKKKHIRRSAEFFVYINQLENKFIRIDVIEIYLNKEGILKINHVKQAFD